MIMIEDKFIMNIIIQIN